MNSRRWVDKRNARNVDLGGDDAHKLLCLTFELEDDSFFHRHFHCRHFNWNNDFFRPFFRLPFHSLLIIYFLFFSLFGWILSFFSFIIVIRLYVILTTGTTEQCEFICFEIIYSIHLWNSWLSSLAITFGACSHFQLKRTNEWISVGRS